jgi:hypothetical protein
MLRKLLFLATFALVAVGSASALTVCDLYTCQASTDVVTDTTTLRAQINLPQVLVKQIAINNPGSAAQTVTIYKNAYSTTTCTAVGTWHIPAASGMTYPISTAALSEDQNINVPYFAVRTSTTVTPVDVTILYHQ